METETYSIGRVGGLDSRAVKEESHGAHRLALAFAKGSHQLVELGSALDLEEDLVIVVGDLDVEVLEVGGSGVLASVVVGHFGWGDVIRTKVLTFLGEVPRFLWATWMLR